ncbi:MAG: hypothetical protein A2170_09620 [Deltaproteobacteria bacterium RBG_13_53_10]|nr:MAG: hypothetical protein A2170_09620 [Deltaproteobacteria bacterium RBG_13_53_10]
MILDGLGRANCENCFALLKPALECTDELNKMIGELLHSSQFHAMLASSASGKEGEPKSAPAKESLENDLEGLKHELMGMISHVIRTPLTVVKESLSLMLDEIPGKLNAKQKELISTGKENVDELIQSVEEIFEQSWNEIVHSGRKTFPAEAIPRKEAPPTPPIKQQRILVIEDQAVILNMLKMRLEANNYEVVTAGDGQEGLDKAHKESPNLIILDVMLPKMNGYKVCQLLKSDPTYKSIPIIISSGRTPQEIRKMGHDVGADAYISKPFEAEVLLAKIKELLATKN